MFHVHDDYVTQQAQWAQSSKTSGEFTISWGDPQMTRATVSPTSSYKLARGYEIPRTRQESDRSFRLIFKWFNMHTGWYVSCSSGGKESPVIRRHTGTFAASGFSGGPQIGLPECRHRYNSCRHQRHQGALYHHFKSKEVLDMPSSTRSSQNLSATIGCVLCSARGNPSTF